MKEILKLRDKMFEHSKQKQEMKYICHGLYKRGCHVNDILQLD